MKEYDIKVSFLDGTIECDDIELVQNDFNSTKFNFTFDFEDQVLVHILYPDKTVAYVGYLENDTLMLNQGMLAQGGTYQIELSNYIDDSKLTAYAVMSFFVRKRVVDTDEAVTPSPQLPILDQLIEQVDNMDFDVTRDDTSATMTITKKDGTTKSEKVYDGESGIVVFEINSDGHLIATAESTKYFSRYNINYTDGHLYLRIGDE